MEPLRKHHVYGMTNKLIFQEENVLEYRPGGYHPVALGDTFKDGRYEIYHKLGYGGFSTVWLARDHEQEKWIALKIAKADAPCQSREISILKKVAQTLADSDQGSPGLQFVIHLIDEFVHQGPNGSHPCLVFELLGPPLSILLEDYSEEGDCMEPGVILKTAKQLLQAIQSLHKAGYVHGDISPRNIAFTATRMADLSEEDIIDVLGPVKTKPLVRVDNEPLAEGVPACMIGSTQWDGYADIIDEEDEDIRLLNLGEAFAIGKYPTKLAQPGDLQAPETIFTAALDYRVDLWRAGLVIYSLVFARAPFHWYGRMNLYIRSLINFAGDLPGEWLIQWQQMKKSSETVTSAGHEGPQKSRLREDFETHPEGTKLSDLETVIRGLTKHLPSDRMPVSQALDVVLAMESNSY